VESDHARLGSVFAGQVGMRGVDARVGDGEPEPRGTAREPPRLDGMDVGARDTAGAAAAATVVESPLAAADEQRVVRESRVYGRRPARYVGLEPLDSGVGDEYV